MIKSKIKILTQEMLKELLDYDPETGIFTWKKRVLSKGRESRKSGKIAGSLNPQGYLELRINNNHYYCHRLAWLYFYGVLPIGCIDHINQIKDDNRIKNLRIASKSLNTVNSKIRSDNKSGSRGVSFYNGKWIVHLTINKKTYTKGGFSNKTQAILMRKFFEKKYFNGHFPPPKSLGYNPDGGI